MGLAGFRRMVPVRAGAVGACAHAAADRPRRAVRLRVRRAARARTRVALAASRRVRVGVHLAVPLDSAHRAAADPQQSRLSVRPRAVRRAVHRNHVRGRRDDRPDQPVLRGGARPDAQSRGVRGRGDSRRHPVGRSGPARGGRRARPAARAAGDAHRAAAGDARVPARRVQRSDLAREGHVDGVRARDAGTFLHGAGDLSAQPRRDSAADGRDGLVSDHPDRVVDRAGAGRASLCARRRAQSGALAAGGVRREAGGCAAAVARARGGRGGGGSGNGRCGQRGQRGRGERREIGEMGEMGEMGEIGEMGAARRGGRRALGRRRVGFRRGIRARRKGVGRIGGRGEGGGARRVGRFGSFRYVRRGGDRPSPLLGRLRKRRMLQMFRTPRTR